MQPGPVRLKTSTCARPFSIPIVRIRHFVVVPAGINAKQGSFEFELRRGVKGQTALLPGILLDLAGSNSSSMEQIVVTNLIC